jgi:hypothetical protein
MCGEKYVEREVRKLGFCKIGFFISCHSGSLGTKVVCERGKMGHEPKKSPELKILDPLWTSPEAMDELGSLGSYEPEVAPPSDAAAYPSGLSVSTITTSVARRGKQRRDSKSKKTTDTDDFIQVWIARLVTSGPAWLTSERGITKL